MDCLVLFVCRDSFPAILRVLEQIVSNIADGGPGHEADLNNVAMRFAMDVTGIYIFAKDFGTVKSFNDGETDELFHIMKHCEPCDESFWSDYNNCCLHFCTCNHRALLSAPCRELQM